VARDGLGRKGDAQAELLEDESSDLSGEDPELGGGSRNRVLARQQQKSRSGAAAAKIESRRRGSRSCLSSEFIAHGMKPSMPQPINLNFSPVSTSPP
jgi:hypothetical protein